MKKSTTIFGMWLREELSRRGLSQRQLSERMGVSPMTVTRWIHGATIPRKDQIDWLFDYFDSHMEIVKNGGEEE